jgi:ABC-type Fe3+/spermidine/putrescine transport system ATPase subunit
MHAGRIEQIDAPDALFLRPRSRVVANFLGLRNIIPASAFADFEIDSPADYVLLHPAFLEWPSDDPRFVLAVERSVFRGHFVQLTLRHADGLVINMQIPSARAALPSLGDTLEIGIRAGGVVPLED